MPGSVFSAHCRPQDGDFLRRSVITHGLRRFRSFFIMRLLLGFFPSRMVRGGKTENAL